jgi:hypothetical protein
MDMVWHHDEFIQYRHGHVFRYRVPTTLNNRAKCVHNHFVILYLTELMQPAFCTHGNVIRPGEGVIVPFQPNRSAMEPLCHIPKVGIKR